MLSVLSAALVVNTWKLQVAILSTLHTIFGRYVVQYISGMVVISNRHSKNGVTSGCQLFEGDSQTTCAVYTEGCGDQ